MSYTTRFTGHVPYSGYVSYSYPASETGGSGSVGYSGTVPVSVDIYVDTEPFDASVEGCALSLRRLAASILAMNTAEVAAIKKSSDDISTHMLSGFFDTVGVDLSQNMASLIAKLKAFVALLEERANTLQKQQLVMQDDYLRVSKRYMRIFNNLNEELERRIISLDGDAFKLSRQVKDGQLYSQTARKVSKLIIVANENEIIQQQLLIASEKARGIKSISEISSMIDSSIEYLNNLDAITTSTSCDSRSEIHMPVIYMESTSMNDGSDIQEYYFKSSAAIDEERIKRYVGDCFIHESNPDECSKKRVREAFSNIVEREFENASDDKSLRIYNMIKKLAENQYGGY